MVDADSIRAYDDAALDPDETEIATVALGCFWGPDVTFGAVDGVVRTRVGYAGGSKPDPTYRDLGGHSEALQVEYDPDAVSFDRLVDVAIENHDPHRQPAKRQYQYILFYDTGDERDVIESRLADLGVNPVETRVEPLDEFHLAEDYHQKYNLRSERALMSAFEDAGYDGAAIRESSAAAKLNARVAGHDVPEIATVQ